MAETIDIRELNERIERQSSFVTNLTAGMDQIIVGQKHLVESLLIGLLSDGHVLLDVIILQEGERKFDSYIRLTGGETESRISYPGSFN